MDKASIRFGYGWIAYPFEILGPSSRKTYAGGKSAGLRYM